MGLHTEAEKIEVSKSSVIKHVGKGIGVVALAIASAFFAAYCRKAFGGVIFALSFVLVVAASIPMVMFFNLFSDPDSKRSPKTNIMDEPEIHNIFNDSLNMFHRDKDD